MRFGGVSEEGGGTAELLVPELCLWGGCCPHRVIPCIKEDGNFPPCLQESSITTQGSLVSVYFSSGCACAFAVWVLGGLYLNQENQPLLCNDLFWFSLSVPPVKSPLPWEVCAGMHVSPAGACALRVQPLWWVPWNC